MTVATLPQDLSERRIVLAHDLAAEIRRQVESGASRLDWKPLRRIASVGPRQIDRLLHERYLTTAQRYMTEVRTETAERLLGAGSDVLNASLQSGFSGPGRLHDALVAHRGLTPGEVRRRGEGAAIAWGVHDSPLGTILLAATARGLAAVRLTRGWELEEHLKEIRAEWPEAHLHHDQAAVAEQAAALNDFLTGRAEAFRPAIDVTPATDFQRAVWKQLQALPVGATITYKELAARVGRPRAVRAVANACARNRLAIAIPCHRALRSDGSLAGFRWGIEWKRKLLGIEMERAKNQPV
jgi:AraC family transcriptional regulator of adaptative response/methylated-DNA-[protein]-cysteine methyltransferase